MRDIRFIPVLDVQTSSRCIHVGKTTHLEYLELKGAHQMFDDPRISGRYDPFGNFMEYGSTATANAEEATKNFLAKHLNYWMTAA